MSISFRFQQTPSGLDMLYGKGVHRVRQLIQGEDFLSVEYYVTGFTDPDTGKPIRRTVIMRLPEEPDPEPAATALEVPERKTANG